MYSSRKTRYFLEPETCTDVLDLFRIKPGEYYKNMESARKESVFQHFRTYFCIPSPFSYVEEIKNCLQVVKILLIQRES